MSVVSYGLRPELFDTGADSRPACLDADRYFLFVGTFAPRKNLETVIRAFAKIHADVPEKLVVVAYPHERQAAIRELARSLHVLDKMAFCSGVIEFRTCLSLSPRHWIAVAERVRRLWLSAAGSYGNENARHRQ